MFARSLNMIFGTLDVHSNVVQRVRANGSSQHLSFRSFFRGISINGFMDIRFPEGDLRINVNNRVRFEPNQTSYHPTPPSLR